MVPERDQRGRFAPAMMGSGVWTGRLKLADMLAIKDLQGKRFGDELAAIGYSGQSPCKHWPVHAHYELHIEQGPILEQKNVTIGAPEGVLCLHWYNVYVEGEANQVGPTPMATRHDALCAAAEMLLKVEEVPRRLGNLVGTVGSLVNAPNSRNIIPDRVFFTVDIRSEEESRAEAAWREMQQAFSEIARRRGCPWRAEVVAQTPVTHFDPKLVQQVLEAAKERGLRVMKTISGAGHDSCHIRSVAPTAMIFVPSINGRSHVECENTKWEDCAAGANVLLDCVLRSANELS